MLTIKILLILVLGTITYQDVKDREVYGFVFLILIGLLGILHYKSVMPIHFIYAVGINLGIVLICLSISFLYARLILKRSFFKEAFGLGDLLFFIGIAIGFPTITFTILLVFSLLFSLLLSLVIKKSTVPLAGYMSMFFGVLLITNWITNSLTLYLI